MSDPLTSLGLVDEEDILLDEAALSLALLDHPEQDLASCRQLLDDLHARLEEVGHGAITAGAQADALSHVFGDEAGFAGDRDSYDDPANADLIRVLERRRGLPISLSILYVAAARRLGWTADILDVPGHVLVLIQTGTDRIIVDPFRGGVVVGPEQLAMLLAAHAPEGSAHRPSAMPNRAVLLRLLLNQATRAEQAGRGGRALTLYRRMTTMAPGHGHAWWQRARLELVDHDVAAARRSLTALLEITREPELRRKVVTTLEALVAT